MLAPESGLGPIGEVRLVPDIATFRHLSWHPTHGIALADMLQDVPGHVSDGEHPGNAQVYILRLLMQSSCPWGRPEIYCNAFLGSSLQHFLSKRQCSARQMNTGKTPSKSAA